MADFRTEYEKVHEAIRNAIIAGKYEPGERLPQRKLAETFNTTTITVREALRFLEQDGLISIEPKWGAMVVEITPEKIYTVILSNAYHIDWRNDNPERHRNLVQSIISGNPDRAESTMREHVRDGYAMELKAIQNEA